MRSLTHGTERGGRALRVTALLTLVLSAVAVPATANAAIGGGLKQLPGTKGCIVDEAAPTGCETARGMAGVSDVTMSPGGENVYVASNTKDSIATFDRNPTTGELTQKASITGCITSLVATSGPPDSCNLIGTSNALTDVNAIAVSPDGENLYAVTNTGIVAVLNRASDGTLTFNNTHTSISGSGAATSVVVSPDGENVYVGGPFYSSIVVQLRRTTTTGPTHGQVAFVECWGNGGGCEAAQNFGTPMDLAVTPDNKELLIVGGNDALLAWNRTTGLASTSPNLTPSATASRCVSPNGFANCQLREGISGMQGIALSDNGTQIQLLSNYSLTTINRNAGNNDITADTAGNCFAYPGSSFAGCTPVPASNCCTTWYPARSVTATPDGQNVYVGTDPVSSPINPSIYGFTRSGGGISLKPTPLGCTNPGAVEGCSTFRQGNRVQSIVAANNNRHVYAVGNNRLFSFALDRPPACQNVGANTAHNTSVTVKLSCSDPDGDAVSYEKLTDPPKGTLGGVQGDTINYNPLTGSVGADSFSYRAVAAGVPSDPATATVNVAAPAAPPPPPPSLIPSTVGNNWAAFASFTRVIALSAKKLPAGAKVVVACKTKKKSLQKKRCPYKSKTFKAPARKNQVNLAKLFRNKKLPIGTRITITITAPTFIGKVFTYTTRKRAIPKLKLQCLNPGAKKPGACPG